MLSQTAALPPDCQSLDLSVVPGSHRGLDMKFSEVSGILIRPTMGLHGLIKEESQVAFLLVTACHLPDIWLCLRGG